MCANGNHSLMASLLRFRSLWLTQNHESCSDNAQNVKHGLVGVMAQNKKKEEASLLNSQ